MRKWRNDFNNEKYETWYDLFDDWDLIESSFLQQYKIRLRNELRNMYWGEFCNYLSGLNGDTALGNVVRIRSEKDFEKIKNFTPEEKRIRNEWLSKHQIIQISKENYDKAMDSFKNMFIALSKKGK